MAKPYIARNQFSDRPPFCNYIERYLMANKAKWTKCHLAGVRVSMGRFDGWLMASKIPLAELNWQRMLDFYRYLAANGVNANSSRRSMHDSKRAIRWGIESGELPQKITDIYTSHYSNNKWDHDLHPLMIQYLEEINAVRPKCYRSHLYALRVFNTYIKEQDLSFKRLKTEDIVRLLKLLTEKKLTIRAKCQISAGIRALLRWLFENRHIKRRYDEIYPARLMPRPPKSLPRPIDPETDQKLQVVMRQTDDLIYKSILLIRRTGLRITELMQLEFDCLEHDIKGRCALKVPAVKMGLERRVPVDPETKNIILNLQEKSQHNFKKIGIPPKLIIGAKGLPPQYVDYANVLTEICARIDAKKWINLHALRHTYATSLLNGGISLTSLMNILGHKSIAMTLGYAKITQEKVNQEHCDAINKLNEAHIPFFMAEKPRGVDEGLKDLYALITKKIDQTESLQGKKKLRGILNRLSKVKTDLKGIAGY